MIILRHSKDQVDSLIYRLKHSTLSITLWLYCESIEIWGTGGTLKWLDRLESILQLIYLKKSMEFKTKPS